MQLILILKLSMDKKVGLKLENDLFKASESPRREILVLEKLFSYISPPKKYIRPEY
jgi:hypothetical protein